MKKISLVLICLLVLGLFTACTTAKTQTMNYDDIAKEMTVAMYSNDFESAAEYLSENAMEGLDASALEEIVTGTQAAYGEYIGVISFQESNIEEYIAAMGLSGRVNPADYDNIVYFEGLSFINGTMGIFFLFDPADRSVVGISVLGTEPMTASSETAETVEEE